ncbi:MAG: adenylate/guanylate cyclase domain-containing protein, partial [Saprospiraceae bacterium]|nr:adenylate/guanylate cyclase domain-containing protein [Saprospiraceae bacterium]
MTRHTRKLAVIMFTDIAGYTAMMGQDEARAMAWLRDNRTLHTREIGRYGGQLLKEMGDGILAAFDSSTQAVACATELVRQSASAGVPLRVGLHQGEVIVEGGDIFGDGVNIAARIEQVGEVGQVFVSEAVHREIHNKPSFTSRYVGEFELKNVDAKWHLYQVDTDLEQFHREIGVTVQVPEAEAEEIVLWRRLWKGRVIQRLVLYLVCGWLLMQGVQWLTRLLALSPYWADVFGLTWLVLLPAFALIVLERAGMRLLNRKWRRVFMAFNGVLLVLSVLSLFSGKKLGATTMLASIQDNQGNITETLVVRPEFRKKVAIFQFEPGATDTATWLGTVIGQAFNLDLDQDKHVMATY